MKNSEQHISLAGIKSSLVGIFTSLILAAIKIFSGIIGNSYALIADGIESIADVFTSSIVLTGLKIATKPPDENHPYGHGKAEPLAGSFVAISLFIVAAIIIFQSIHEIITPHHAPAPFTLFVLIIVIITKETLFRHVNKVGQIINSISVKNDAWHHRSDAITSAAAFVGISIALIGGEGYEMADDIAALFASLIIIINGYLILKPAIYELTDANLSNELIDKVKKEIENVDQVIEVEKCLIRKMGFDYFVDVHVVVDGHLTVAEGHNIAHIAKEAIKIKYPQIMEVLVHIEPNSY
ncbi:MAG: cation transporter [Ignavibacteriales bacterium]|nr:cation transporter [Ignavibacteriales bacterium]